MATIHSGDEGLSGTSEANEYGVSSDPEAIGRQRYGWLGAEQRAADTPSGIVLMGVRLYNPTSGRFLQTDPVYGGSCNAYEYTCADPVDKVDLDGKWPCWSKVCALRWAAQMWKAAVKKIKRNKYFRACLGGAVGVLGVDTWKNGWKALKTKWFRWGPSGCAGGMFFYHAKRRGWW